MALSIAACIIAAPAIELAPKPLAFITSFTLRSAPAAHAGVPSLNESISFSSWKDTVDCGLTSPLVNCASNCCENVAVCAFSVAASFSPLSVCPVTTISSVFSMLFTSTISFASTTVACSAVMSGTNSVCFCCAFAISENSAAFSTRVASAVADCVGGNV